MIRPFCIQVPDAVLSDLRRRLAATRWPADFANEDWRYGANVAYLRELVRHWLEAYDWREREALMNRLPQYRTEIDGIPIHFVHLRGRGPAPLPLLLTHGWPWTFWDYAKIAPLLADPAAHGADPADAFDLVIPALPGYPFSTPLTRTEVGFARTADLWAALMERLGYARFGAQGGDWGSFVAAQLGHRYPERLVGIHIHTPAPLDFLRSRGHDPADFAPEERAHLEKMRRFNAEETGYMRLQCTKPMTPAVALHDSPAGLLAWLVEKRRTWSDCGGQVERRFSRDELIDHAMLYWAADCFHTSARFYWEAYHRPWQPDRPGLPVVPVPTAIAILPGEITYPPRAWAERYYHLVRWSELPAGGHFAVAEEPERMAADLRAFFRPLRREAGGD